MRPTNISQIGIAGRKNEGKISNVGDSCGSNAGDSRGSSASDNLVRTPVTTSSNTCNHQVRRLEWIGPCCILPGSARYGLIARVVAGGNGNVRHRCSLKLSSGLHR